MERKEEEETHHERTVPQTVAHKMKIDETLDRTVLEERCQVIYYNLFMELTSSKAGESAPVYARALKHTMRCDSFKDFSDLRGRFEDDIGKTAIENIYRFDDTPEVEARAVQSMMQYKTWHRQELWKALCTTKKAKYCFVDAILGVPYGGYHTALKIWKDHKTNREMIEAIVKGAHITTGYNKHGSSGV